MIRIENLSKTYKKGTHMVEALKDVTLSINKGEIFGIIGLSGAGKSSLIRCLNRIEEPTSGSIWINETDITTLPQGELRELRKRVGMIFQSFNLLNSKSVFENIAFPLRLSKMPEDQIQKRVKELLKIVELSDKAYAHPRQLSGGQKQRVGIARALATEPDILLCDEATSALDPKTTKQILSLIKEINESMGLTVVLITHEMEVIKEICHKVAILEEGRVVEFDDTIKLFTKPSTDTNRHFIAQGLGLPDALIEGTLLRLNFSEESATNPIIYRLIKSFDTEVNILTGSIEYLQGKAVGRLLISIAEDEDNLQPIIKFLEENLVSVEVIKDGKAFRGAN